MSGRLRMAAGRPPAPRRVMHPCGGDSLRFLLHKDLTPTLFLSGSGFPLLSFTTFSDGCLGSKVQTRKLELTAGETTQEKPVLCYFGRNSEDTGHSRSKHTLYTNDLHMTPTTQQGNNIHHNAEIQTST